MKAKLLLTIFALQLMKLAFSQAPQSFSWQAVIRDSKGAVIVNQPIALRFTINHGNMDDTITYQEIQTSQSNDLGLVAVKIGNGTIVKGALNSVPWQDGNWMLNIEADITGGTSYTAIGLSQLLAVPYAMYAAQSNPVVQPGNNSNPDSALFVVKDRKGNIVFAVYETGVDVIMNNAPVKGARGGFTVGGRNPGKGTGIDKLMNITVDSTRFYITDSPVKGARGGFAVGGRSPAKGSITNDYFNIASTGSVDTVNGLPRVLWYPRKEAFLVGNVLVESPDSVGTNSFASGFQSKAIGNYSQAFGYQSVARGVYSTSMGYQTIANSINSYAFGQNARALKPESYAFGRGAIAEGLRSFSFGSAAVDANNNSTGPSHAIGDYSMVLGQGSVSVGKGAFAAGLGDSAIGVYSIAMGISSTSGNYATSIGTYNHAMGNNSVSLGYNSKATGDYSTSIGNTATAVGMAATAIGYINDAMGDYSVSMGYSTHSTGNYSVAIGYGANATGYYAIALGNQNKAYQTGAFAIGLNTIASGFYSTSMGAGTIANGNEATAIGAVTTAKGTYSLASGFYSKATSFESVVIGQFNDSTSSSSTSWVATDPAFIIGNGSADWARSNALTVLKNGRIGLQSVINPTYALQLPNDTAKGIGSARAYAWTTYSDSRLKGNQVRLNYGLNEVMQLRPREYTHHLTADKSKWNTTNGKHTIGLIAQEVYSIIPEAVDVPSDSESLWGINYDKLVPVLINAVQEQQKIIENQQSELDRLKNLETEVAELKALLKK